MLVIKDLLQQEEILTDFKSLTRTRKLNGEKTISLTTFPTSKNKAGFDLLAEESTITFDNENYIIKKHKKLSVGNTFFKQSEGMKDFFVNLINSQQTAIHNGSMTFQNACQFVLGGLYTFNIVDSFTAKSFENFGNDNRLALFQKIVDRYGAEFTVSGNVVTFKRQIGNDTDFQFRYGHNIKSVEENIDTTNLATVIRGKGKDDITAYYRSPNADIFGEIDAPFVDDERFTTEASLLEELNSRLQDTPEVSITIDFVDLRAAGYPYTVPNEGDRVFIIYEPMDNLLIETRIVEVEEEFDINLKPIKTQVTLSNYKKSFSKTMFSMVQKALRTITNDDGVIKYNVLDEAVKLATESLQSAQTELKFENGIVAISKTNPNHLVVFNSAGIGISTNGGSSFRTAMTAQGLVADVINAGQLNANNVTIYGGSTTNYTQIVGARLSSYNNGEMTEVYGGKIHSEGGFYRDFGANQTAQYQSFYESYNGALRVGITSKKVNGVEYVATGGRALVLTDKNITTQREKHSASTDKNGARFIDFFADETLTSDVYGLGMHIYSGQNLTIESEYDINFVFNNEYYADMHGGGLRMNTDGTGFILKRRSAFAPDSGAYYSIQAADASTHALMGIANNNFNLHLRTMFGDYVILGATTEIQARNSDNTAAVPMRASSFPTTSSVTQKDNIRLYEADVLSMLMDVNIYEYHLRQNLNNSIYDKQKLGMISEATLPIFRDEDGIDPYNITSFLFKVCQNLYTITQSQEERINDLETIIGELPNG